jgi:hypothetical protein
MNDDMIELVNDMLVEEGHYIEKIQAEAMEEAFLHHTVRDFDNLLQEYGAESVVPLLTNTGKKALIDYLQVSNAH